MVRAQAGFKRFTRRPSFFSLYVDRCQLRSEPFPRIESLYEEELKKNTIILFLSKLTNYLLFRLWYEDAQGNFKDALGRQR